MAAYSTSTFPYDCVVLIESPDPTKAGYYLQGSGSPLDPTPSLRLRTSSLTSPNRRPPAIHGCTPAGLAPIPPSGGYISTTYSDHFNQIGVYGSIDLTKAESASDYAVIDTSYIFSTWMGVLTDYAGGEVHLTGYPASARGEQVDQVGAVTADPSYSVLDYTETDFSSPGDSGGPIWSIPTDPTMWPGLFRRRATHAS